MKYKMIIEADANDGDMFEESFDVGSERILKVKEMLSKINHSHGIYTEDYCIPEDLIEIYKMSEEDVEWWQDFLPNNELTYGYCRLTGVTVFPILEEEVLY